MAEMAYLDNGATSFPKPESVYVAMDEFYRRHGVNPGRSGADAAVEAGNVLDETRKELNAFFGNPSPDYNRLIFTSNATDSLNTIIQGVVQPGDHVVSTRIEHNSVLRPLHEMANRDIISFDLTPFDGDGFVDPDEIAARIRPETRLVLVNHGSNVIGTVQDITAIGAICHERDVLFAVDAAQTAGCVPIDMTAMNIDMLAFTGHKSLLGPVGIGGVAVGPDVEPVSYKWGGTGVKSAQLTHLEQYPYRLEAGTLNTLGIAGLRAGLQWILAKGMDKIVAHEIELSHKLCAGLAEIPGLTIHGAPADERHTSVISVTLAGMNPEEIGMRLDIDYDIITRTGLQCAPLCHEGIGTAPLGTVRFSIGPMNRDSDVDRVLAAMQSLTQEALAR